MAFSCDRAGKMPNGIKLASLSPEAMRSAVAFDCLVTVKLLLTRRQRMALKGPDEIAQGFALGSAAKHSTSPERAK